MATVIAATIMIAGAYGFMLFLDPGPNSWTSLLLLLPYPVCFATQYVAALWALPIALTQLVLGLVLLNFFRPEQPRIGSLPAYTSGNEDLPPPRIVEPGSSTPSPRLSNTRFIVRLLVPCAAVLLFAATVRSPFKIAPRRAACQNNEKQLGLVFLMYSGEHEGWPPLSLDAGVLQPDWSALSGKYLLDRGILVCSSDSDVDKVAVTEGRSPGSYYYLGYVVQNEKELEAFRAAYRQRIAEGGGFEGDLPIPPEYGGGVVRRLSPSAISELAQKPGGVDIPVLFERPDNHVPGGMNVLYADGHVEFVKFGAKFPAIQATIDLIDTLERSGGQIEAGTNSPSIMLNDC